MNKFIVAVLAAALALLLLGGPLFAGEKAQQSLDQWVVHMNSTGAYDVQWKEYEKGWLSSRGVLALRVIEPIRLPTGETMGEGWQLPLKLELNHGPLMFTDDFKMGWFSSRVSLSDEQEAELQETLDVQGKGPFFQSRAFMDLSGNTRLRDRTLAFSYQEDGNELQVAGFQGDGSISRQQLFQYTGVLPGAQLFGAVGGFELDAATFDVSSDLGNMRGDTIVPGEGTFAIKSLSGAGSDGTPFSLKDAKVTSFLTLNEARTLADLGFKANLKQAEFMGEAISDVAVKFQAQRISLAFMEDYSKTARELGAGGGVGSAVAMTMMASMSKLLPGGPRVALQELKFTTEDGSLDLSATIEVAADAAAQIASPMEVIKFLKVNAEAEVDKDLAFTLAALSTRNTIRAELFDGGIDMTEEEMDRRVESETRAKLEALVVQRVVVEQGEQYISHFVFDDGRAVLNEQHVPLPF